MSKEESIISAKKKKKILFIVGFIIAGLVILAVLLWKLFQAGNTPTKKVVFKVGDEEVYLNEVNLCILQNMMDLKITTDMLNTTTKDGNSVADYYKNEILQVIRDYKVEAKVAQQKGITLTDEEEKQVRTDAVEYMAEVDGHILSQLGITQDCIIEVYTQRYLARALEETVTKEVKIEDQNYCTLYLLVFPKIKTDENGSYIKEKDSSVPVPLSDEEIAKRKEDAEAAYESLISGTDIEEVAEQYGVKEVSGEESNLADSFGEPFSDYAKKLKEGEYSPILETENGYAILKMIQVNNKEMASQILEYYKADLEKDAIRENKSKWYKEAGIAEIEEITGNVWKSVSLYDFVQYVEE